MLEYRMTFLFMIRRFLKHKPYKKTLSLWAKRRGIIYKSKPYKTSFLPGRDKKGQNKD